MARVLGLVRQSGYSTGSDSEGGQRGTIRRWTEQEHHEIVGWAVDLGVSGSVAPWERKSAGEWFLAAKLATWDVLVVDRLDRLDRDVEWRARMQKWARANGKLVVAASSGITHNDVMFLFDGVMSQTELEKIARNNRISWEQAHEAGRYHGGNVARGYKVQGTKNDKWLVLDTEQADIVRQWADQAIAGASLNSIALAAGMTVKGITDTLTNPVLIGYRTIRGKLQLDHEGNPVRIVKGETVLDEKTYRELQRAVNARRGNHSRTMGTSEWLGIAQCACGQALYRDTGQGGKSVGIIEYFKCKTSTSNWRNRGSTFCGHLSIRGEMLAAAVESFILETPAGEWPEMVKVFIHGNVDAAAAKAKLEKELQVAQDATAAGFIEADKMEEIRTNIERRMTELAQEPASGWEWRPTGRTVRERWESAPEQRREHLIASGWQVIVGRTDVQTGGRIVKIAAPREVAPGEYAVDVAEMIIAAP